MTQNNFVQLIGFVGNHLIKKTVKHGNKISFCVATHHKTNSSVTGCRFHTTWHDVIVWGKLGTYAENNLVKGSRVLIQGKISYQTYPDLSGHIRYVTYIIANQIINLDR